MTSKIEKEILARVDGATRATNRYFSIDDGHGNQLTTGLSPETARRVAQDRADELGAPVWLYDPGDADQDGEVRSAKISPSAGGRGRVAGRPARSGVATRRAIKSRIEDRAISGLPVDDRSVAIVSRDRRSIRLRHVWPDDVDARVWSGVRHAFLDLAHQVARETGRPVEVYAKEGFTLEQIRPERSSR